jgi:hypothetical protein
VNCNDYQVFRSQIGHNLSEQNYQLLFSIPVNIAADGGQQVNVKTKRKKKAIKERGAGTSGARRLKAVK